MVLATPEGEIDREIVESMVSLLDREGAISIALTEQAMTGLDAMDALARGDVDIALISNEQPFRDDIATIMPLYATVLHIVHRGDTPPESMAVLFQNASVFAGQDGSASRRVFERLVASLDLEDSAYTFITDRSTDVDLAVVFAPISPDRLAAYPGVRLWSIGTPDDIGNGGIIDATVLMNPHFRPFVIPTGTYADATPHPIVTVAVDKLIVARESLDPSIVYDLVNEILRARPALGTVHPGLFQHITSDFDVSRSRYVVHAGTQDYLQRSEPTFVERYSGVAEVLVTLLVATVSAAFAGVRILERRRKNRIDRYYGAVLDVRKTIDPTMNTEARQEAATKVRSLQDEAFALLVDEKLAADESFRIFITLCNDVLHELENDAD